MKRSGRLGAEQDFKEAHGPNSSHPCGDPVANSSPALAYPSGLPRARPRPQARRKRCTRRKSIDTSMTLRHKARERFPRPSMTVGSCWRSISKCVYSSRSCKNTYSKKVHYSKGTRISMGIHWKPQIVLEILRLALSWVPRLRTARRSRLHAPRSSRHAAIRELVCCCKPTRLRISFCDSCLFLESFLE